MHMSPCIKIVYLKIISGHHVCTFSKVSLLYDLSEGRLFDKIENSGKVSQLMVGCRNLKRCSSVLLCMKFSPFHSLNLPLDPVHILLLLASKPEMNFRR